MVLQPIKRPRLWQQVEEQIKALIFTNKLRIGDMLPSEEELAQKLQVGRRSVREALHSLQKMGIVEIRQGKGAFFTGAKLDGYLESLATSISFRLHEEKTALLQLLEVRKILEAEVASLSTSRTSNEDLRIMEENLARQRQAIKMGDLELFNSADLDFHNGLVKGCKNSILEAVYNALSNLMLKSRQKTNQIPGVAERSLKDHQDIFLAVRSGNAKKAYRCMLVHMNKTEQNIKKIFKEKPQEKNKDIYETPTRKKFTSQRISDEVSSLEGKS